MPEKRSIAQRVVSANPEAILRAAGALRRGGLVAFPTETVYGLGADAENDAAMRALFAAKGRPADHPVIVHLADAALVDRFVADVPEAARKLAAAFWPGPMTLVLRRNKRISDLVTGGLETVGLRVPAHRVARDLLQEFGGPIAAPSANRFGRVSCTRAKHVVSELGGRVDLILDGGECEVGLESTIIDVSSERPAILRPGAVTAEDVVQVLGDFTARQASSGARAASPRVPGSLASHYAPQTPVELVAGDKVAARAQELVEQGNKVVMIGSNIGPMVAKGNIVALPTPQDETALAHELYSLLRQADELGCDIILAVLPAERSIGVAIADRLRRAAGPKGGAGGPQSD